MNVDYAKRQFELFSLRAMRAHAEIVSGAYKLSKKQIGCERKEDGRIGFRPMTDEEKLVDKVDEMDRHIHFAQESADFIAAHEGGTDG